MSELIRTTIAQNAAGSVATVTICRPKKLNCLNSEVLNLLEKAIRDLSARRDELVSIILTGEGDKAFIAGADLAEMSQLIEPAKARNFIRGIHQVCNAIRQCPVVVIARINGVCLGGGLEVAAACDIRVATSNAILGMPESRMGVPSVVEAALLPGLIGWGRTRELLLLGGTISAQQALEWGLVSRVANSQAGLDSVVAEMVKTLCACGRKALSDQKALMLEWEHLPIDGAIQAGVQCFGQAFEPARPANGMASNDWISEPRKMMTEFLLRKTKVAKL